MTNPFPFAELMSQDGLHCFRIGSYGYAYPEADNEYDADWHRNPLSFTLPGFKVAFDEIILSGGVVEDFVAELKQFRALAINEAVFDPIEPFFQLTFSFNQLKKVVVSGYVEYPVGEGAQLQFEFETDLTYVDQFAAGLKEMLQRFPVRDV
ncbi:hypothetical protein P4475_11420 [Halalkalibacterium halodurans]|jgi:hypothetical protein|uniref:WapI family immunity protein n=1 Tax=Halalkalibacterium halodurans TaxID=86665 RepID=UPI001067808C|nr:hypothetical protein [Halalkalibacterium halodurans]MDY7224636.1 hypothetical protein [Halalkalibacterium halodurans]MDY7240759.1 hypothetical protein [Halalkalibacterium halodurans]MED3647395.1 hypothetical protein [Halalkalibacterium halodurans]MED4172255.1 hypothetical protein [Halalkalibacterium halodurans]TES48996.1 hypothetical protein E2L07_17560 [Halalkalibacterium halodurans]